MFNVFQESLCHPKMALVIDDRLKVWDDRDQPRVHVVPAFAPYYAPQAEVKVFALLHMAINFVKTALLSMIHVCLNFFFLYL